MAVEKTSEFLIGAHGSCSDCGIQIDTTQQCRKHVEDTGHTVFWEKTYSTEYNKVKHK